MQEMWETQVQPPGCEDPLEEKMATHSSILAWEIPWTEECGGLQSMGPQRVGFDRATEQQQICYISVLIWNLFQLIKLTSVLSACMCVHSQVRLFVIPWTVAHRALVSMEFSRQKLEWVAVSFSSMQCPKYMVSLTVKTVDVKLYSWMNLFWFFLSTWVLKYWDISYLPPTRGDEGAGQGDKIQGGDIDPITHLWNKMDITTSSWETASGVAKTWDIPSLYVQWPIIKLWVFQEHPSYRKPFPMMSLEKFPLCFLYQFSWYPWHSTEISELL